MLMRRNQAVAKPVSSTRTRDSRYAMNLSRREQALRGILKTKIHKKGVR